MKRPLWLGAGIALGVGGTLWAEQRVRRQLRRAVAVLSPGGAADAASRSARQAGDRVRVAVGAARLERSRREAELWASLGEAPPRAVPVRDAGRAAAERGGARRRRKGAVGGRR
jgi:hypothetical protein